MGEDNFRGIKMTRAMTATKLAACLLAGAVLSLPASQSAWAGPVVPGFDSTQLPANDDGSSSVITLPFTVDFYGTNYDSLYVNNNGNFTFNAPTGVYTPFGVGSGYLGQPIIAGFFADVDTRGDGSGLTSWGTGTFDGHEAFGATWPEVGYYGSHTDKLNTFQIILVNRSDVGAGDFDIVLNYDQVQWETGDASGGNDGLGGTSAAVGFSAGTGLPGTFFQFPGSLENGALIDGGPDSLVANTNDGVAGQYIFAVRGGNVIPGTPEPSTWAMLLIGFAGLGFAGYHKAKTSRTV
jgi:hypothetical protein